MSDEYDSVFRGPLKLKKSNISGINDKSKKKKKKNKVKREKELLDKVAESTSIQENNSVSNESTGNQNQSNDSNSWMTEAQKKFLAQQEKRQLARVMAKASKTHKQRVEEFNSNLEKLSEHYDIPKVSWTK